MTDARGFWSYVHKDDEAEGGRIARLARDVVAQYEVLTGDTIELFLDRDSLEWGDDWRPKVDSALSSVAFFIPVLTPRYFQSAECRRELAFFARRATTLGVQELVMPILYVRVPGLHEEQPADDAIATVKPFQWVDWTELRFSDVSSTEYRKAVATLAERLAEANAAAERTDVSAAAIALSAVDDDDESLGTVDRIARAEEAMPQLAETTTAIAREIDEISELMQDSVADIEKGNMSAKPMAARLTVLRRIAADLRAPAERIRNLGREFARQLHDVDDGFRLLIIQAPAEAAASDDAKQVVCEFFESIKTMARSSDEGLGSLQVMINEIRPLEAISRDLRPILRSLRNGLMLMVEGRDVINEWVGLVDSSPVDCPAAPS